MYQCVLLQNLSIILIQTKTRQITLVSFIKWGRIKSDSPWNIIAEVVIKLEIRNTNQFFSSERNETFKSSTYLLLKYIGCMSMYWHDRMKFWRTWHPLAWFVLDQFWLGAQMKIMNQASTVQYLDCWGTLFSSRTGCFSSIISDDFGK